MTTSTHTMTAHDLLQMPDDGCRYELVRGELRKMTPPGHIHGRQAHRCSRRLGLYVEEHNLGEVYAAETGFLLATDPDHVRAPDAAFVRRERVEAVGDTPGYFPGAPDLALEVISPNDRYTDVDEKVSDWLTAGTRMVIVINPRNRSVRVHTPTDSSVLSDGDTLDGGDVVPGWQMPVRDIFA